LVVSNLLTATAFGGERGHLIGATRITRGLTERNSQKRIKQNCFITMDHKVAFIYQLIMRGVGHCFRMGHQWSKGSDINAVFE